MALGDRIRAHKEARQRERDRHQEQMILEREQGKDHRTDDRISVKTDMVDHGMNPQGEAIAIVGAAADAVGSVSSVFGGKGGKTAPTGPQPVQTKGCAGMAALIMVVGGTGIFELGKFLTCHFRI